ncbi:hypothetical protein CkaCkLH20_03338 [Colletotrichum karsti]|uniref:F-box domain-containing protein n=1 Tax=Colletotrichum karsti TaxID=1095194 RepID=A0A9P6LN39_9PEZI|nr:uncharacterized protein CkaCkLH20_03338 [Colletotrichum karsti]KAF9879105.1 hypothetical protein CkaCkLH20_03338 [Colletotrichum karsti]
MSSSPGPQSVKNPLVITSLPPELVMRIIDLTHPSDHVNLAYTCKKIAQCSSAVLRCHREAHEKRHTVSDLLPDSILNLLRSIVWGGKDAISAWHTRFLEIWGPRTKWEEWVPFMLEPPERFDQAAFPCKFSFDDGEVEDYMRLLEDELHLTPEVRSSCEESLRSGQDDVLKVLVIALCPYLESLKYIWTKNDGDGDSSLHRLAAAIAAGKKEGCWPPGLWSLREVAVGVNSGTWLDETPDEVRYFPETLAELLKLPRIESIYYHGLFLGYDGYEDEYDSRQIRERRRGMPHPDDPICDLTPGCSSVEHLVLHHFGGVDMENYLEALLAAPRALKSLALRGNDGYDPWSNIQDVVTIVRERHSSSLESLMMYNANMLHGGFGCMLYSPDCVGLQNFTNLRHAYVDHNELTEASLSVHAEAFTNPGAHSDDECEKYLEHVISHFPKSMEVLLLAGWRVHENAIATERCMIRLIESRRYPKLKAIHIQDNSTWRPSETLLFQRLIEVGQRYNIDIVTASAGNRQRIHQIDFHAPPDYYDLASGPHARDRDHGEWVFSPFSGRWEPKGCGNCGNCEECFYVYTREAWETRGAVVDRTPQEESATAK